MSVLRVNVALPGQRYFIEIGSGLLSGLGRLLRSRCPARRATIITDDHVGPLYGATTASALRAAGFDASALTVPAGEASKTLAQVGTLYDALAASGHARDEPIIALGGGVVGDVAGFVAATWLRGVPFVQCPTSLEADVDAAVGGKTAVNHPAGKNMIGAFHQPILVCIDTDCLATLPPRDFTAGLAESVKHAVIRDPAFFDWHRGNAPAMVRRDPATTVELIRRNCAIKADVVAADERETDGASVGRAALNFGHTIGHALEAQPGLDLRHGEAVALGMVVEMDLAVRWGVLPANERDEVEGLLRAVGLPIRLEGRPPTEALLERLGADKKIRGRSLRLVVPARVGEVVWRTAPPPEDIEQAMGRLAAR